jgi:hypothetical protein
MKQKEHILTTLNAYTLIFIVLLFTILVNGCTTPSSAVLELNKSGKIHVSQDSKDVLYTDNDAQLTQAEMNYLRIIQKKGFKTYYAPPNQEINKLKLHKFSERRFDPIFH